MLLHCCTWPFPQGFKLSLSPEFMSCPDAQSPSWVLTFKMSSFSWFLQEIDERHISLGLKTTWLNQSLYCGTIRLDCGVIVAPTGCSAQCSKVFWALCSPHG